MKKIDLEKYGITGTTKSSTTLLMRPSSKKRQNPAWKALKRARSLIWALSML